MNRKEILVGLLIALVIGGLISLFASFSPDGLEKVAQDKGFLHFGEIDSALKAPFAGYMVPKIPSDKTANSLAGIFGTLIVFAVTYFLARQLKKKGT